MTVHIHPVTPLTVRARRWWHHLAFASGSYNEDGFRSYDIWSITILRRWYIEVQYNELPIL